MNRSAFTLTELSIVMVIIGVLVGATLTGTALLKNTEVKTMLAEAEKLKAQVTQFQTLYKSLPGDMADAESYWGTAVNGNGNGQIEAETSDEAFQAIQQLKLADLIEGNFTGTWGSGFVLATAQVSGNVIAPPGRDAAGMYIKCCSGTDYARTISFNNHISLFSIYTTNTSRAGILTPVEARDIDNKIDDGVPDTGFVGGSGGYTGAAYDSTGCYSNSGSTSTYNTAVAEDKNNENCQMQFAFDW